jgi:hypothetical protein
MSSDDAYDLDPLDRPIWGAIPIGERANVVDSNGKVRRGKIYSLLNSGRIPAQRMGKEWVSTQRQINRAFNPELDRE